MTLTPEQRSLRSRIAAHTRWSTTTDRRGATAAARRGFDERFEREVDPEGTLDPAMRAKLAENARRAHFLRMAAKSAKVRAKRKAR
jgi:hypothetical protein